MRPFALLFVLFVPVAVACSSSSSAPADAGISDAAQPNQPLGGACDPALAQPCTQTAVGDPCAVAVCDPTVHRCVLVQADAAACGGPQETCTTNDECAGGVCVQGLCYTTCLGPQDCDGGTCALQCSDAGGPCIGYCASTIGTPDRDR